MILTTNANERVWHVKLILSYIFLDIEKDEGP